MSKSFMPYRKNSLKKIQEIQDKAYFDILRTIVEESAYLQKKVLQANAKLFRSYLMHLWKSEKIENMTGERRLRAEKYSRFSMLSEHLEPLRETTYYSQWANKRQDLFAEYEPLYWLKWLLYHCGENYVIGLHEFELLMQRLPKFVRAKVRLSFFSSMTFLYQLGYIKQVNDTYRNGYAEKQFKVCFEEKQQEHYIHIAESVNEYTA